jgi:hypothetical protein
MNKRKVKNNNQGVAILMVMTSIAILSFLLADFTFETKINKIKVYNQQDKVQAKLNAESGLAFGIAKLKIYQNAINQLEKNASLKQAVSPSQLTGIITQPFIFPIPALKDSNIIQRTAIEKFTDSVILQGELSLTISAVSGFLNPNNLRIPIKTNEDNQSPDPTQDTGSSPDGQNNSPNDYIEDRLVETLTNTIEEKRENDSEFDDEYGDLNPELLIKELKFYVNDANVVKDGDYGDVEGNYSNVTAKHAPLSSLSELYLLEGWTDKVVDLIKDRLTVHEASIIQVNEITKLQLKVLFPGASDDQLKEFFTYRDGAPAETEDEADQEPHELKTEEEFKNQVISLGMASDDEYTKKIKQFEKAGLKIGFSGKLYKILSIGKFGRATYRLTAFVDLPIMPVPKKIKPPTDSSTDPNGNPSSTPSPNGTPTPTPTPTPIPQQLMEPRVVEILIG